MILKSNHPTSSIKPFGLGHGLTNDYLMTWVNPVKKSQSYGRARGQSGFGVVVDIQSELPFLKGYVSVSDFIPAAP
jgi:hypothetical protein